MVWLVNAPLVKLCAAAADSGWAARYANIEDGEIVYER